MKSNNTFNEGMSSDISKLYQSDKTYLKAENFRPVTTVGGSNGSLVNIKGTNCEISFPQIRGIYKLSIYKVYDVFGAFFPGKITITINGQTTSTISINETTTTNEVVQYIKQLSNCYNGIYSDAITFSVAYNTDYIFIYQKPDYKTCSINDSVEPEISIEQISGNSTIGFVGQDGVVTIENVYFIPPIINDSLVIIGSTYIGEIFYIFTCPESNSNLTGQIWELTYDEVLRETNIKLIYNNILNFSKEFPIPPSACIGRFEIPSIQRIYWSDNNNPVRSLNVKDNNLMALNLDLLDLTPSIKMSIPTLKLIIDSGSVNVLSSVNTYQCAYRLIKSNGAISAYSMVSNIVNPIVRPTGDFVGSSPKFASLNGDAGTMDKSISWEVSGIDTNFTTIQFIVIIRNGLSEDNYLIYKYEERLINGQSTMTTTFTNDIDNFEEISLDEFLLESTAFTHCKTLEQKDNRLFFANVRNGLSDYLESFDTRVFRFDQSSDDINIKNSDTDSGTNTITIIGNDYSVLSETADLIPAYNLGITTSDDPDFSENSKYQRNSTVIGGTGPNISYKFGSLLFLSDETPLEPQQSTFGSFLEGSTRDNTGSSQVYINGYRRAGVMTNPLSPLLPHYTNLSPNQKYYTNLGKDTMGLEYYNGNYRSYQHNEIYRFGIVFYYKNGNKYFVKWIGDIKFPNYSDSVAPGLEGIANDGSLCSDFRSMYYDTTNDRAYCNLPYIQFEINIPDTLARLISGYQIVRVKRQDNDMSITGQGLINQVLEQGPLGSPTNYSNGISFYDTGNNKLSYLNPSNTSIDPAASNGLSFHPFKNIVDQSSSLIVNGDKIIFTEKYAATCDSGIWPLTTTPPGSNFKIHWWVRKFYQHISFIYKNLANSSYEINDSSYASSGFSTSPGYTGVDVDGFGSLNKFFNTSINSAGSPCVAISTNDTITWNYFGSDIVEASSSSATGTSKLLGIHFKPGVLKTQYGGRNFIARSQNEYISCGAFCSIDEPTISQIKVWGGDIYSGILDIQKEIKEFDTTSSVESHSQTWYFPTQSKYNVDLRSGQHINSDLNDDGGAFDARISDDYFYNYVLSFENTLYTFFPKPFDFNDTSTFSNRIYWSDVKFNGETNDSWTSIPILNNYDVDGNYGGITALITLRSNVYFIQESALGLLLINQQSLMTDTQDVTLKVGIGTVLTKHLYTSVDTGSKHQWSIYKSDNAISFIDIRHKKIILFNGQSIEPISDTKSQRGFLNKVLYNEILVNDNPIIGKGILTTYDFENNEFLYTFVNKYIYDSGEELSNIDERYTLVYSDLIEAFSSFYSGTPYIYLNNHNKLYSSRTYNYLSGSTKLYIHNKGNYGDFYEELFPSRVKVNINATPKYSKVYDNLSWLTESIDDEYLPKDDINNNIGESDNINNLTDTFNKIRCYNESQNSDWIDLDNTIQTGNLRKSEQNWNIQVPRSKINYEAFPINTYSIFDPTILTKTEFGDRFRDKYMIVDLEYSNELNNRFIVHNLESTYRTSDR